MTRKSAWSAGYTGTVHFTATNGAVADYTFRAADMGSHTFTVGVPTPQTLTITAADSANTRSSKAPAVPRPASPGGSRSRCAE